MRGKPHLAKWLPDAASNLGPEEFARLVSFEPVTETAPDFGELGATTKPVPQSHGEPVGESATQQLRQRQRANKEAQMAEHGRLVAAEHAEQSVLREQMKQALQNEDHDTRASRAAMDTQNRDAAKAAAADHAQAPGDKRSRRVQFGALYSAGVSAYRDRPLPACAQSVAAQAGAARVLVRARPLFVHETDRGEWDALSTMNRHQIVVHEAQEAMRRGGMVHLLRHHAFNGSTVNTDAELYESVRYLVSHAAEGGLATLFCYGMTGSGKTYSMDSIHHRVPADIFTLLASTDGSRQQEVKFSSYELLAKRCFELLPEDYAAKGAEKSEIFLRVDGDGATNVCGIAEHTAHDEEGLAQLLRAAVARRETSATGANATSSRSHAVYLLQLPGGGRLHLIDLAGNEGSQETLFHNKTHIAEAKEISSSLAVLRQCLRSRSQPESGLAPFRESILTRVLKDALTDPQAATALLACVSPCCTHVEHSLRTLRTAMNLTEPGSSTPGNSAVEEEELRVSGVINKAPSTWDNEALCSWVQEQHFGRHVKLPSSMTGNSIMKLTKPRLKPLCGGLDDVAAELFSALRVATKEADKHAREQRVAMKQVSNMGAAAGFARDAPSKPQIAAVAVPALADAEGAHPPPLASVPPEP